MFEITITEIKELIINFTFIGLAYGIMWFTTKDSQKEQKVKKDE